MVSTTWRWVVCASTSSQSHSAHRSCRLQRPVLPREAFGPDPQQLLQMPLDELEKRRLARLPRPVHLATDLHAQPQAGGRVAGTSGRRTTCRPPTQVSPGSGPGQVNTAAAGDRVRRAPRMRRRRRGKEPTGQQRARAGGPGAELRRLRTSVHAVRAAWAGGRPPLRRTAWGADRGVVRRPNQPARSGLTFLQPSSMPGARWILRPRESTHRLRRRGRRAWPPSVTGGSAGG